MKTHTQADRYVTILNRSKLASGHQVAPKSAKSAAFSFYSIGASIHGAVRVL